MEIDQVHYYDFNVGDYRRDTSHLTLLEHGIYRQLLDTYYLNEGPLTLDKDALMRTHCVRTADEVQAFENVLRDFFQERENGFFHAGCEKVLGRFRSKSGKARASAMARWAKTDANALPTHSERSANGMLTNNQEPITTNPLTKNQEKKSKPKDSYSAEFEEFWSAYPRQVAKAAAWRRWKVLMQRYDGKAIAESAKRYAQTRLGADPTFTPHPATWLHQERFFDAPPVRRVSLNALAG